MPNSGLLTRLKKGIAAGGFGQLVSVVIQFLQIHLLIKLWGAEKNGEWMMLSAIPAQLALGDLGFGAASGNEMTMRVGREDRDGALRVFQSSWSLISALSLLFGSLGLALVFFSPWHSWISLRLIPIWELDFAATLLILMVVAQQQLSLIAAGYKCDGLYARCISAENFLRLGSFLLGLAGVLIFRNVISFAAGISGGYIIGVTAMAIDLKRQRPWIKWGIEHATFGELKPLIVPAFSFMLYPMGHAISQQWFSIAVGTLISPAAVSAFGALRTLSRVVIQATSIFSGPVWVELSAALGRGDYKMARKLHHTITQAAFIIAVAVAAVMVVIGEPVYKFYTDHQVPFDQSVYLWLLAVGVANSLWSASSSVCVSINKHQTFTAVFLAVNFGAVFLVKPLIAVFGMTGAAMALFSVELVMALFVVRNSLYLLDEPVAVWFQSMLKNPKTNFKSFRSESAK